MNAESGQQFRLAIDQRVRGNIRDQTELWLAREFHGCEQALPTVQYVPPTPTPTPTLTIKSITYVNGAHRLPILNLNH